MKSLTPAQNILLKACLSVSKEERLRYVTEWDEQVAIHDLDFSSSRLIPYFFYRNQQDGIVSRHENRIKIIYKHWWLRTQHINHEMKKVVEKLSENGIEAVGIKGASIRTYYEKDELRPMADFDLLVSPENLQPAIEVIKKLKYLPNKRMVPASDIGRQIFFDFDHALSFSHQENDTQADLHWKIGAMCSWQFTEHMLNHLEAFETLPNVKKPSLAHEVLMIIIHAVASDSKDNLNWIIDIAVINESAGHSFWTEARELAVAEKKEDLFDYGCSILIKMGVYAPDPGEIAKPRYLLRMTPEERIDMPLNRVAYIRIHNMIIQVNRLYPHASAGTRVYYFTRWLRYYFISKNTKLKRESS